MNHFEKHIFRTNLFGKFCVEYFLSIYKPRYFFSLWCISLEFYKQTCDTDNDLKITLFAVYWLVNIFNVDPFSVSKAEF